MKYKVCSKCRKEKPFSEFNSSKTGTYGLNGYCRICDSLNKKKYYQQNKEHCDQKTKEWSKKNPERRAVIQRRHKDKYKEHYSEYCKEWVANNRDKCRLKKHRYYAKLKRQLGDISPNIIDRLFEKQKGLCNYCNRELQDYHLEHKIPISRGGLHDDKNLCLSCPACNLRKKDKTAEEFFSKAMGGNESGS
jgi:hypothetical protein